MRSYVSMTSAAAAAALLLATAPAFAASCGSDAGGFPAWLDDFRQQATAQGISERTVSESLEGVTYDRNTVQHDRGQGVFHQTFEQFSGRMVPPRVKRGADKVRQYSGLLQRIESQYGVQGPVLIAIWGLETDFGSYIGSFSTIRSLATLAYDCRRSDKFRAELIDALRIVQRGDLNPSTMHGAWAGEIGQTQFMPSSYVKFAVDFDGKGRRDLIHSVPDVLASTAKYLQSYGWQAGQGWAPGQPNFPVIQQWNASQVYSKTIALLATRIDEATR